MDIIIQELAPGEQERVIIKTNFVSDNIARAINILKSPDSLPVLIDEQRVLLPAADIYYIESVDLKTFVYGQKAVYRSRQKLYEVEEALSSSDFLRISKQVVLNIKKIKSIAPAGGGRFEATLLNGEKVVVSRQYLPGLKERFGI